MSTDDKDDDFQELYMDVIQSVSDQEVLSKVWKIGSRESLEDFIQRLQTEQETRRKPEDKSAGSYFQSFCVRISKFLEMYAGIADVVKSFDQRVGALAYGSLSILVTVVRNKRDREETIASSLADITQWLGDLREFKGIYQNEASLNGEIRKVVTLMIHFAIDAWKYWSRSRIYRMWRAVTAASKYSTQNDLDRIKKAIERVRVEMTKLLHHNIQKLKCESKEQYDREWRVRKAQIRGDLSIFPAIKLEDRSEQLETRWRRTSTHPDTFYSMQRGTKDTIEMDRCCKEWMQSTQCSILLITGINHPNVRFGEELWLSSAITSFAAHASTAGQKVVFHALRDGDNPSTVLSAMIGQILDWDEELFKQCYEKIVAQPKPWNLEYKLLILKMLVRDWIRREPQASPVYVVLDRVDRFPLPGAEAHGREGLTPFIRSLMRLLQGIDEGAFKLMMLADAVKVQGYAAFSFGDSEGLGRRFYQRLGWRQGQQVPYP